MVSREHLRIDQFSMFWDVDFSETFSVTWGLTPKSLEFCDFCSQCFQFTYKRSWLDTLDCYAISGGHRRIPPPLSFLITFTSQTLGSMAAKCISNSPLSVAPWFQYSQSHQSPSVRLREPLTHSSQMFVTVPASLHTSLLSSPLDCSPSELVT